MKLCTDCDLNYRTSKNKRLLVELTLIQLAQITSGEEEAISGGRSPKQVIKPIFNAQATTQVAHPDRQPSVSKPQQAQPAPKPAPAQPAQPPQSMAATLLAQEKKEEKKIPVMRMGGLGVSIKQHPQASSTVADKAPTAPVAISSTTQQPEEDYIFNERDINYYWQEYAGQLPVEQVAIAKRMHNMRPTLLNDTTFEVTVDNEIISKEFTVMIPAIQDYLRTRLKNRKVTMTVRVSAPTEKTRAYSRVERFQMMAQKNNALLKLKEELGLELY